MGESIRKNCGKYEITDEALRVYEQIRANIDITQLVCKLLSMVVCKIIKY